MVKNAHPMGKVVLHTIKKKMATFCNKFMNILIVPNIYNHKALYLGFVRHIRPLEKRIFFTILNQFKQVFNNGYVMHFIVPSIECGIH